MLTILGISQGEYIPLELSRGQQKLIRDEILQVRIFLILCCDDSVSVRVGIDIFLSFKGK